jgi:hypothetical protein
LFFPRPAFVKIGFSSGESEYDGEMGCYIISILVLKLLFLVAKFFWHLCKSLSIQASEKSERAFNFFCLGHLNFGNSNLPFDSFDLEALDRLAQGGEPVEPFRISSFGFPVYPD